jgi:periplasmic copper chaperone A
MKIYNLILFVVCSPIFANAHVTLEPISAPSGSYSKLVFRVPHGCDGSSTKQITVQIPEGVLSVKPQVHPGWKISTKQTKLKVAAVLHGKSITDSISEVTWKGGPLADECMDEFGMSVKLPESPNERLVFPVIQECVKGTSRWTEVVSAEHAGHGAKLPAPTLLLEVPIK